MSRKSFSAAAAAIAALTFAVTENIQNFSNTPDVGFHLGLAYALAAPGRDSD